MRAAFAFVSVVTILSVAACSVTSTSPGDGSSGSSGSSGTTGAPGTGTPGAPSTSTPGTPDASKPVPTASTAEAPVDIDGTCSPFAACGGNPQGTYDYTAGCITDVFSAAKAQCPTLDTSNAKVNVKGSLFFNGAALHRDGIVVISGSIVLPASCAQGQCAAAQTALGSAFDTVTCTGTSSCTCTVSKTTTVKNDTTYAVNGNTLTTDDGDSYQVCSQADSFRYTGKSLGAENGIWELEKR